MLKIIVIIYFLVMGICFLEAYFCTKFDPESDKFLKERKKNRENEHKSTS
jgi:hypothetical protein